MTSKSVFDVLPATAPKAQKDLLTMFTENMSSDDYGLFSKDLARDMIDTQWELTQNREPGKAAISFRTNQIAPNTPRKTIIDIVHDDIAFLIDSVSAKINTNNLLIDLLMHPIVGTERDKNGTVIGLHDKSNDEYTRESHIHIHIKETLSQSEMDSLEANLRMTIEDVDIANRDWHPMMDEIKLARAELETANTKTPVEEVNRYCKFLDYLYDNNFTFLGFREYEFHEKGGKVSSKIVKGKSLGILSNDIKPAYINDHEEGLPHHMQEMRRDLPAVYVSKTNRIATVHRRVPMDAIAIKIFDEKGNVKGEKLFLGLFTSVTYSRSVSDVPYLSEKVDNAMELSGYLKGSHNRKAMRHILEKYPRDELFQIPPKDLLTIAQDILRLQERQRIALFTREDPFGRYISCLVYIPRDRFGTKLRKIIGDVLETRLNGTCTSFATTLDDSVFARVMFLIAINDKTPPKYDTQAIEEELQSVGRTWSERLNQALSETDISHMAEDVITLKNKYSDAFSISYTENYAASQAVYDIGKIEKCLKTEKLEIDLFSKNDNENTLRLKLYNPYNPVNLSDVLPILENMGFKVVAELPFNVKPANQDLNIWVHDFELETTVKDDCEECLKHKTQFEMAFKKAWAQEIENDEINALVAIAGINWRETTILRSYVNYTKQIRIPFSTPYIRKALKNNPKISQTLVAYFNARFNPDTAAKTREKQAQSLQKELMALLQKVDSLDEDRILRAIMNLIESSLRTNFFQMDEDGNAKPYISIKLDSANVTDMPRPVPYREIFVYSPRVEAVHLRGDSIARGGLRWSDRREDFRTEVLGLMKAQMVKNAVIVPVGAKGGFVVKTPTNSREEFKAEGIACYKTFIRGLLDITDNLNGTKVIHPKDVVRLDDDDPYLVVAADKGTATFSDTANSISKEYGFWMGDAFASGGSAGYDHKKMGITAKGAWESVKLHFRHLNHDTQTQEFDVTGIGDMGGDVFGNGMLLSEKIRLIGAFNHLHIFCDPEPNAETSFKERQRLFDNVMGWNQYDERKLSKGGAIFNRSDKTLKLSPEIQKRFDINQDTATPNELMRAILKARTDLLWFGGIGTYIKATSEDDTDVGDKSNDPIRINGEDLRAKVIGEGANLATTQLGRIEFAKNGGRINTDFIDNSGGVDSSDHEVNIKILMRAVMDSENHTMDIKKRNKLLESMTDKIGEHVLRNNYQQALAVSMTEFKSTQKLSDHKDFIKDLEKDVGLSRELEYLPTDEQINSRMAMGKGLTRPEISVLTSYAKIQLTKDFLNSNVVDHEDMQTWMFNYFPSVLTKSYKDEICDHKLRREIIAMRLANSIVNRMGPSFVFTLRKKSGGSFDAISKAYTIVREIFTMRDLWDAIEALDNKVPADVQMKAMHDLSSVSKRCINWFLSRKHAELDIAKHTKNYKEALQALKENIQTILSERHIQNMKQKKNSLIRDGVPENLAHELSLTATLENAPDIIRLSLIEKFDLQETAQTYYKIGKIFHLDWLRSRSGYSTSNDGDPWYDEAMSGMVEQLDSLQSDFTQRILKDKTLKKSDGHDAVDAWTQKHDDKIADIMSFFEKLRAAGSVDLSMLIVAEQKLRRLYGG